MTSRPAKSLAHVDYDVLDAAKNAFITASRRTLDFAKDFGFVPDKQLGASANIFSLDLKSFLTAKAEQLEITLLPEGLGTADDARPNDLTEDEAVTFWHNIAYKTVSAISNDAASGGLQPVLLSLYLPSATPESVFTEPFLKGFLDGIVEACKTVGCVYFSGETPQLKNKLHSGVLDIAGATFGLRPAGVASVDREAFGIGNFIVMLASSGVHENGFTSFRELATELSDGYRTKLESGTEYWQALNAPSVLYSPIIQNVLRQETNVTNLEPISGHGWQKLMRPAEPLRYRISEMLPIPEIFRFIEQRSGSTPEQMVNKFNYGAGYAIFTTDQKSAEAVVATAANHGVAGVVAGQVESADHREVVIEPLNLTLSGEEFQLAK